MPEDYSGKYPTMPKFEISVKGVAKLLSDLNIAKTAGPNAIKPIVFKELSSIIALVVSISILTSIGLHLMPLKT